MNVHVVAIFVGRHGSLQVLPPRVQKPLFANETEPWGKEQVRIGHHVNQTLTGDPLDSVDFVGMRLDGQVIFRLDAKEEHIVDFVLSPRTARRDKILRKTTMSKCVAILTSDMTIKFTCVVPVRSMGDGISCPVM